MRYKAYKLWMFQNITILKYYILVRATPTDEEENIFVMAKRSFLTQKYFVYPPQGKQEETWD